MKKLKTIAAAGIILFLASCNDYFMVCSINPFYKEGWIILDPMVEGTWKSTPLVDTRDKDNDEAAIWKQADTTFSWKIERYIQKEVKKDRNGKDSTFFTPKNHYIIKLNEPVSDSAFYQFKMVLFDVNGNRYADIMPLTSMAFENSRMARENYLMVHTLARVKKEGNSISLSWLSEETMRDMIENKHVRASYVFSNSINRLMLSGSSKQLAELLERHAGEKRFIDWEDQPARMKLTPEN